MLTRRHTKTPLCIIVILTLLTAGCWDRKEIENRGLVLGVAIDHAASPHPKGRYDLPRVAQEAGARKYKVTFELPMLRKQSGDKDAGGTDQHLIFSGEGESFFAILRAVNAHLPFALFFEDIQLLVFSESVAREGLGECLDFFTRDHEVRRRVKLMVTPGRAEDILSGKLQSHQVNSLFISQIGRNVERTPRFASKTDLGNISAAVYEKRSFFMPVVVLENGDVKLTQAAIFNRETKLVGIIDEYEIIGAKIIRKVLNGGIYNLPSPADPRKLVAFELLEARTKVASHLENGRLRFTLEASFVGYLAENRDFDQDALDPAFLAAVEQGLAAQFTRQVYASYRTLQTLRAENLDLGSLVHRQHPAYWKKIKDRWDDEIFPTVPLEVNITVLVRRTGLTR